MSLLECKNVSLGYSGRTIINDLSFQVNAGDYLCIVGENGAGKSTLVKTLVGLKEPMSGEIVTGEGLKKNEIGYLPQQTQVQKDFPASVWEVVLSGCLNKCGLRPFYSKEQKKTAKAWMEKLGITELSGRCYRELSGGQQQRVLLCRALCAASRLLLLDEPVAGLDPKVTNEMYELIDSLNKNEGITIIMVSHDIGAAVRYTSHILHISHSDTIYATKEDYLASEQSRMFVVSGGEINE